MNLARTKQEADLAKIKAVKVRASDLINKMRRKVNLMIDAVNQEKLAVTPITGGLKLRESTIKTSDPKKHYDILKDKRLNQTSKPPRQDSAHRSKNNQLNSSGAAVVSGTQKVACSSSSAKLMAKVVARNASKNRTRTIDSKQMRLVADVAET